MTILFLAGSFPHLTSVKKERELMQSIEKRGKTYNRLVSFYYPKTIETVLTLKKERIDDQGRGKGERKKSSKRQRGSNPNCKVENE